MGYSFRTHVNYFYDYPTGTLYLSAQQNMLKIRSSQEVYRDFALFYSDVVRRTTFEPDTAWGKRQHTYLDWLLKLHVLYVRSPETVSVDTMLYRLVRRFSLSPDDEYHRISSRPIGIQAGDPDQARALRSSLKDFGYFHPAHDEAGPSLSVLVVDDHADTNDPNADLTVCFDRDLPSMFRSWGESGSRGDVMRDKINRLSTCTDADFALRLLPAIFPFFLTLFLLPAVPAEALVFDERNYPVYIYDLPDDESARFQLDGAADE